MTRVFPVPLLHGSWRAYKGWSYHKFHLKPSIKSTFIMNWEQQNWSYIHIINHITRMKWWTTPIINQEWKTWLQFSFWRWGPVSRNPQPQTLQARKAVFSWILYCHAVCVTVHRGYFSCLSLIFFRQFVNYTESKLKLITIFDVTGEVRNLTRVMLTQIQR